MIHYILVTTHISHAIDLKRYMHVDSSSSIVNPLAPELFFLFWHILYIKCE